MDIQPQFPVDPEIHHNSCFPFIVVKLEPNENFTEEICIAAFRHASTAMDFVETQKKLHEGTKSTFEIRRRI